MDDDALRVEFKVSLGGRRAAPNPAPGAKLARQRQDRAARRARNLALAYWIDHLVRSGEVADLAEVARMCGVALPVPPMYSANSAYRRPNWGMVYENQ